MTDSVNSTVQSGAGDDRPIVLFDGVCRFCDASVNFIIDRDPKQTFRFAALQSDVGQRLLCEHQLSTTDLNTIVLIEGSRVSNRSTAALRIARRLRFPWNLLCVFLILPNPLRDFVYKVIAANRYRWFGKRESCRIPTEADKKRFLDDADVSSANP